MKLYPSLSFNNRLRLLECLEILLSINDEDVTQCVIDLDDLNSSLVDRRRMEDQHILTQSGELVSLDPDLPNPNEDR